VVYASGSPRIKVKVGSTARPANLVAEVGRKIRTVPIPPVAPLSLSVLQLPNVRLDLLVFLGKRKLKRRRQENET